MLPASSRWLAPRHVRGAHEASTGAHRSPAAGRRAHRARPLERGDRESAGHLSPHREGPLRRPAPEARRLAPAPDPRRVSTPHRRGSPLEEPRPDPTGPGGLTAPAPAEKVPRAREVLVAPDMSLCDAWSPAASDASLAAADPGSASGERHHRIDRRTRRSATPYHQAASPDEAAGRDDRANHPSRRAGGLWEDDAREGVVRAPRRPDS